MNTKKDIEYERNDKRKRYVMCFLSREETLKPLNPKFVLESKNHNELENTFLIQINHDK